MQKYGTRGEEIRKIMQNQALDIGDPGLFGHGLLQYVSDEDSKNNELVPVEEPESEDDESTTSDDDEIIEEEQTEQENRSEEHTSELQSRFDLVCRLLLEKK